MNKVKKAKREYMRALRVRADANDALRKARSEWLWARQFCPDCDELLEECTCTPVEPRVKLFILFDESIMDERVAGKEFELIPCTWDRERGWHETSMEKADFLGTYGPGGLQPFMHPVHEFGQVRVVISE